MFFPEDTRREIKRRMRETRERRWRMSQEEMAEMLRNRLDPTNRKYPSARSYARWESLNSPELPQSEKKLNALASVMELDLSDLYARPDTSEDSAPATFIVVRRLDELLANQEQILQLLGRIAEALEKNDGDGDDVRLIQK